ncbi:MAG: hypothetical protein LBB88_08065 [Planctomycetaceae bacterium]|jgi:hypothetical protein|nr:hypothetical protein [Planctomycetaceae bacterium]
MFRSLQAFSVFCTIIAVNFIVGVNIFTIEINASESDSQNTPNQDNSFSNSQYQTYPNDLNPTPSLTPHVSQYPKLAQQKFRYISAEPTPNSTKNEISESTTTTTSNQTQPNIVTKNLPPLDSTPTQQTSSIESPNSTQSSDATTSNPVMSNSTTSSNVTPLSSPTPSPPPIPPSTTLIPEVGTSNPFQFREADGEVGLVPRNILSLPTGIQVIGIMIVNEKNAIAAIRIPKINATPQRNVSPALMSDVYYVHEGDIIEIPTNSQSNRSIQSTRGNGNSSPEILFLVVEKITSQHVEVRSRSNIADKHILR